ncbi:MAG: DUF1273 domain-containing protein [Oscillospiraceae bacterium]|jgi:uncharacterized phage-like protein YoqJ|nr:DUF1273 domain-containing protein [Oscillospiraceae bacterium]
MTAREHTACFSGHRDVPAEVIPVLREALEKQILFLLGKGVTTFLAGGARGFDALAAAVVLNLRKLNPQMKLILVLPCPDQGRKWVELERELHDEIKRKADGVITLFDEYHEGCMQTRNRYMVDNSIVCIAYLTRRAGGGTYHTVRYCKKQGVMVVNLTADNL